MELLGLMPLDSLKIYFLRIFVGSYHEKNQWVKSGIIIVLANHRIETTKTKHARLFPETSVKSFRELSFLAAKN